MCVVVSMGMLCDVCVGGVLCDVCGCEYGYVM